VISSEILLEKLLEKLLQIAVQTAGAERGVLVRVSDNGPLVEADGGAEHVELVAREPVAAGDRASPAIVNYALRTREPVVLEDACAEKTFASDPYIASRRPRSVLAVPILGQGEVKSVLYLENNLTTGAFTPDRVEVLRMLSIQAAVSLENAQLYSDLSRLNQAYERFVPRALLRFLDKKSIVDVSLGDHVEREVSVLFSDIRSFTSISSGCVPRKASTSSMPTWVAWSRWSSGTAASSTSIWATPSWRSSTAALQTRCLPRPTCCVNSPNSMHRARGVARRRSRSGSASTPAPR
jgi:hypothetical protein